MINALFGLVLAPLYSAIAMVETQNGVYDSNVYQITHEYVLDLRRLYPLLDFRYGETGSRHKSEMMMYLYWKHYGHAYSRKTGRPVTYEVLARIHNGGPNGWRNPATDKYWTKVRIELEKRGVRYEEEGKDKAPSNDGAEGWRCVSPLHAGAKGDA